MKKYKTCEPFITISNIRTILSQNGIFLREKIYSNSPIFHACKVSMQNDNLSYLNICSNGKGITYEYSLASGYAEFMERLQNDMLIRNQHYATKSFVDNLDENSLYKKKLINKNLILDFRYDPFEKNEKTEIVVKNNFNLLNHMFPFIKDKKDMIFFIKNDLGFHELITIPFFSYEENAKLFLPIELILVACGSNGMCSGNTRQEALIQGFCELYERYAGRELYFKRLTPPDIPLEYFKRRNIYDIINKFIDSTGYIVKIKDCSLGLGLPVFGILVIDTINRKYNFHLGASLDPDIALERCFTEIHQNPNGIYWNEINIGENRWIEDYTEDKYFINGNQIFANGTGLWPSSIFNGKPSYSFDGLNYNLNKSDKEDIEFIIDMNKKLGFSIYTRDVSFLDFNSYYIFIPGMSEFPIKRNHYLILGDTIAKLRRVKDVKNIPYDDLVELCVDINENYDLLKMSEFHFQDMMVYHSNVDIHDLELELLLFMMNYRIDNLDKSLFYLEIYLKDKPFYQFSYYYAIRDLISLRKNNASIDDITNTLSLIYPNEYEEVIDDIFDNTQIFKYYEWSNCFECEFCQITDECRHFEALSVVKRIKNQQKIKNINQINLLV